jgi:hypothetical protein
VKLAIRECDPNPNGTDHQHSEYIVNALVMCAESYFESKEYRRTIQYASGALEYDNPRSEALMMCARAFEQQSLYARNAD